MENRTITGRLAKKGGRFYAVIYKYMGKGEKKEKWISLGMTTHGNHSRAQKALETILDGASRSGEVPSSLPAELSAPNPDNHQPQKEVSKSKTLFSTFMKNWLEYLRPSIELTTYAGYHRAIYSVIVPYFDALGTYVEDLTTQDLETFYRNAKGTRKPNTIIKYHANIRKALQWALRNGIVDRNVALAVNKPKKEPYTAKYYNLQEMKELLEKVHGTQLEFAVLMACHYGLRREEIVGLRWDAVDAQYGKLQIKHIVTQAVVDGKYQEVSEDRAKTQKSLRSLPLFPSVLEFMGNMLKKQDEYKKIYGKRYDGRFSDYLYLWPNGERVKPDWITHAFHDFLEETGLPDIRFHDLRHSCATLLRQEGVPMEDIQKWLGHSTIVTTEGLYAHYDSNQSIVSANKLASALGEDKIEPKKPEEKEPPVAK
jgi:integrase